MRWKILSSVATFGLLISVPAGAQSSRWGADYFPNVPLTTQDGRVVRFYDDLVKGKIVAIDLIYTTCQYACPLETARLAQVQRLLGDRMGRDVFFYSITIDPEHDTPAVLKAYGEKYGAGPGWLFLTGTQADIDLISRKTGLYSEPNPSNPDGHTPSLLVGNQATGQWMRNSAVDNPKFLARTIGDWLNSWQTAKKSGVSFADAPTLNIDQGQYTFHNHCAACHTIGRGDRIGPDLAGVTTTRDRDWLARFIAAPDRVRAAGDPIATALHAKYNEVWMPNLGLGPQEVAVLIAYIDEQSSAAHVQAAAAEPAIARPGTAVMTSIVEPYLRIQHALNIDAVAGIKDAAQSIASEAAKGGQSGASIRTAAAAVQRASTLAAARTAMGALSDALITYAKKSDAALGDGVKVAYCPMVRKSWLQRGETIQNPYYGQAMSDCGRFVPDTPAASK